MVPAMTGKLYPAYIYLGDRSTDSRFKNQQCVAVRNQKGKCIRGRNGNMLVQFGKEPVVVVARLLRKVKQDG